MLKNPLDTGRVENGFCGVTMFRRNHVQEIGIMKNIEARKIRRKGKTERKRSMRIRQGNYKGTKPEAEE